MTNKTVLTNIKKYLRKNKISYEMLANDLGWKYMKLARKLTDFNKLNLDEYIEICDKLLVPPTYFLEDK